MSTGKAQIIKDAQRLAEVDPIPKIRAMMVPVTQATPKPKRFWDNYVVVGDVPKTSRLKYVVAAAIRDGVKCINIREFYYTARQDVWRPGRDGIVIPLEYPIEEGSKILKPYEGLIAIFDATIKQLSTMPLYDPENAVCSYKQEEPTNENQGT